MPAFIDLTGKRFGRLTVLGRSANKGAKVTWACRCDCGKSSVAFGQDLRYGKHTSCGCYQREVVTRHGHGISRKEERSITYGSWQSMKDRCSNPSATHYDRYGGRGISYDPRWADFESFLADMGERPSLSYTLERKDNDGNYCKGNCRWATRKEQAQNRHWNPAAAWSGDRDALGRFKRKP